MENTHENFEFETCELSIIQGYVDVRGVRDGARVAAAPTRAAMYSWHFIKPYCVFGRGKIMDVGTLFEVWWFIDSSSGTEV